MKYAISDIAQVLGATESILGCPEATVSTLLIDSRSLSLPSETLFFALRTSMGNGHKYVSDLYDHGVRNFVVESLADISEERRDANYLVVNNTLIALQMLAAYHRHRFESLPIIAITGSRGKTRVKEWLNQLLSPDYRIVRSPRSFNSQIGVPLSLWNIDDDTTLAIIEAGISTTGEMASLQAMIAPTMGVITNVGDEHDEGFSSIEEKIREKARLLQDCKQCIYCGEDQRIKDAIPSLTQLEWSQQDDTAGKTTITYTIDGEHHKATVPFTAPVDIENAVTCLGVLLTLGITPETIAQRMALLTYVATRINVIEGVNNCTIIEDGYTSDLNSLAPAIDFVARRTGSRPNTVIMSDLMDSAPGYDEITYKRVAKCLTDRKVSRLLAIGPTMCKYAPLFGDINAKFFESTAQFVSEMSQGDFEDETVLVKGAPGFDFDQVMELLEAKRHQTVEEVDLNALAHNFKFFKSLIKPTTKTVAMVKASGYGAGSYEVAKTLQDRGADYLAVACQDEGVELRMTGITMPIIVLNPQVVNYKAMFTYNLEPEVYSLEECMELIREGEKCGVKDFAVHIKIDTGMHRLGFTLEQLPALIELLKGQDVLKPTSVFSHLCVADEPSQDDYTMQQLAYFDKCTQELQSHFDHHLLRHILNTSGIVRFPQYQHDMVRIGVGLYGIKTVMDGSEDALQPVSSLKSVIISIKEWPAGTTIGYGRHGVLTRDSRIATVTIGYADGLDRHLGNGNICMWAGGKRCPTVGNVCMDAVMLDITDTDCKVGDIVEIFGNHIPVEELSDARGTIPYEILTSVSPRVKRVYYRE